MPLNVDRLTVNVSRFEGLELRGDRVVVRVPSDARASVAVVCIFENADTAKRFLEVCDALPELVAMAQAPAPQQQEGA